MSELVIPKSIPISTLFILNELFFKQYRFHHFEKAQLSKVMKDKFFRD